MAGRISEFMNALYNSKKKQLLGRDGGGWGIVLKKKLLKIIHKVFFCCF